jgi:hypothetical protein
MAESFDILTRQPIKPKYIFAPTYEIDFFQDDLLIGGDPGCQAGR